MSDESHRPPGTVVRFDIYSHHVRVSEFSKRVQDALFAYCAQVASYRTAKIYGQNTRVMDKVFIGVTRDRQRFSFHINEMDRVIKILGMHGIPERQIWQVPHALYEPTPVHLTSIDNRTPEGEQGAMINYVVAPGKTKLLTLEPGGGKTLIALTAFYRLGQRVFLNIRNQYIKKWIEDFKEAFQINDGDILVIKGTPDFAKMTRLAKDGQITAKFIICSNKTYLQYLKNYEFWRGQLMEFNYACYPWELFELLGVGIRVIDEVHQDFHLNYRQDLYSHVPKTLSMSGSLDADNKFTNERNDVMFPPSERFYHQPLKPHVVAEAITYRIRDADRRVEWINKQLGYYSHMRLEKSLLKKKKLAKAYFDMVGDFIESRYVQVRQPGQKMVVFFHMVDTCTQATEIYQQRFPHLKVMRYTADDDYQEMLEHDLIVSTTRSLGTAIDVPDLVSVLMTDAINSRQANLQVMGRLRKLRKFPDTDPVFYYLVCVDIDKHVTYHDKKVDLFRHRVKKHEVFESQYVL